MQGELSRRRAAGKVFRDYNPETNLSREKEKKKDKSTVEGKNLDESSVGKRLVKSLVLLLAGRDV